VGAFVDACVGTAVGTSSTSTTTTTTLKEERNNGSRNNNKHHTIALYFLVHSDLNKKRNRNSNRNKNHIISLKIEPGYLTNTSHPWITPIDGD